MNDGFVKAAAISTRVTVADPESNCEEVCGGILKAASLGAKIMVFPELCLTGYTCGDLFYHDVLIDEARQALSRIKEYTKTVDAIIFVGCPVNVKGALYNCAVAINRGKIIGVVPKSYLPEYNEFYEKRQFTEAPPRTEDIVLCGDCVPFGQGIVFECDGMPEFTVGAELCEDLWVPMPPSTRLALSGATIIVNLSASNESVGKSEYRRLLVSSQSARLLAGYVYCSAGEGESTTDLVFSGHCMIAENGKILAESKLFDSAVTVSEIDVSYLSSERAKIFTSGDRKQPERTVKFFVERTNTALTRTFMRYPFVPSDGDELFSRSQLILTMQSRALQKRIEHTNAKTLVVGVSGGLDSSLALIVAKTAADAAKNKPRVIAVTMPCFGTTRRTHDNSLKLAKALGVDVKEVNIKKTVLTHFKDIGHDDKTTDVTYENAQARERTQVLMDIANMTGGLVVGTGDLSEFALGWATYNGDHMSMYAVNASVPKTLIRYLISHYGNEKGGAIKAVLSDILVTPVSPELLPPSDGDISQKTEDIVGPYELHDFFLYYMLRCYYSPRKLYRAAQLAFPDYDKDVIYKWLKIFIKRFFAQQFKRSCMPDGVKVGSVALSPRGDWRMPSDASVSAWLRMLDNMEK